MKSLIAFAFLLFAATMVLADFDQEKKEPVKVYSYPSYYYPYQYPSYYYPSSPYYKPSASYSGYSYGSYYVPQAPIGYSSYKYVAPPAIAAPYQYIP